MTDVRDDANPADALAALLGCPPAMLDVSLDQLRTLAVVHATGTAQQAARSLGREQSSVQKQLDNLNKTAVRLVGEALVVKQGRGKDFLFTPSGEEFVALAAQALHAVTDMIRVAVAAHPDLRELWPAVEDPRYSVHAAAAKAMVGMSGARADLPEEQVADILYGLLSPELFLVFTRDRSWTAVGWERWVTEILTAQLLEPGA